MRDPVPHLEAIQACLPTVRDYIQECEPDRWPFLRQVLQPISQEPLGPLATLPLAAAWASEGSPGDAVPVAAAWEVFNTAIRHLDDLHDRDGPGQLWQAIGDERTFNLCGALLALTIQLVTRAPWPDDRCRRVTSEFTAGALRLAAGQDRDLSGPAKSMADYWRIIDEKNGSAFAMACAAGAWCATVAAPTVDACRAFGRHLGIALQLFDDMQGIWEPQGGGDPERARWTLPVLWALTTPHPHAGELRQLLTACSDSASAERLRDILDAIGARTFVVRCALAERDRALAALEVCPGVEGRAVLEAYATVLFSDLDQLVAPAGA